MIATTFTARAGVRAASSAGVNVRLPIATDSARRTRCNIFIATARAASTAAAATTLRWPRFGGGFNVPADVKRLRRFEVRVNYCAIVAETSTFAKARAELSKVDMREVTIASIRDLETGETLETRNRAD